MEKTKRKMIKGAEVRKSKIESGAGNVSCRGNEK